MTVLKALIKAPKNLVYKYLYITPLLVGVCVLTFTSCEQKITSREYEEIVTTSSSDPHDFMRSAPFVEIQQSSLSLSWETPQGWSEKKGSGMRLVTFRDQSGTIECSIISLGGRAGGLESNVARWMNQINVIVPANDQFNAFLSRQKIIKTKGDFLITAIDLSEFSEGQQALSMIAAIAELEDKTIFVKMTGNRGDVVANRKQFISLIKSLAL